MDLNNFSAFKQLDTLNMLGEIENLPGQLQAAWELSQKQPLPDAAGVNRVIICGMGGSAIGADLLAAYIGSSCPLPVVVHRDYGLPAWASGAETLVITSSHSGNTEETLEAFQAALSRECRLVAVSTGGKLAIGADQAGLPLWKFTHKGQPRAAVGFSFGLLLGLFFRLGLIPDPARDLAETLSEMSKQQEVLRIDRPLVDNPAKRMAGDLSGKWVNVYGSGNLAPVARRWKGQINEVAKAGAGFEQLPEADHNALAGLVNPDPLRAEVMALFLGAPSNHPRNRLRLELTRKGFEAAGLKTKSYEARGESALAHVWTTLHFGDYLAYYLAMTYEVDPTPVDALEKFKVAMQAGH